MGLSPYSTPSDAGILYMILYKTAMSISFMKQILRSILGIDLSSREEFSFSSQHVEESRDSNESREIPSNAYLHEFRTRTPALRFGSISGSANQECSVCLTEFKPDSEINHLNCGHVFHKSCLEKWLNYWNITCPLCRNRIMARYEPEEIACPM